MKETLSPQTKSGIPIRPRSFFSSKGASRKDLFFQPKLKIGPVDDAYEREADAIADQVMRVPQSQTGITRMSASGIQRKCSECEKEEKEKLQRKAVSSTIPEPATEVYQALNAGGQALDTETRSFMESRFGQDFSQVKIHTDELAAKSAASINALAYTSGNHVVFNQGQYAPGTDSGKKLLAHELTHVVQQNGSSERIARQEDEASEPNFTETADPCTYRGAADQEREIHLNLGLRAVRVYTGSATNFRQFDNIIVGPSTYSLARKNGWCHMYPVLGHQLVSGHGLINFVNYCGNFGFHSNFWRQTRDGKRVIERIPGAQSAGCARLDDPDKDSTGSAASAAFYNLVRQGDCVRIYDRSSWRRPTFKRCREGGNCRP
ncbi:eCIS core domain-containing protein [Botryobacter ruber]|uniref:eCIS core domain-containing protein n=1 Tax=Botryobacter ruber TaxID=2171629 RepID=UPI000E0C6AEF|nr:DUF4157 domain-containing protein [Botryobacter ruber]